jgi:hypothetical protein
MHELSNSMEGGELFIRHGFFEDGKLKAEDV